ncbi:hypothetical protein LQ327_24565 [Actinomycetospora endophytica]|uniref:Uncharacterized protein n=1 Tax=Actinomycetospora endophytica TaxID=2291215 RepID=A0ABS8PE51_9PSEU|nr:hypothetical protein [Actinomycetospora endophytica]MCD2196553.1 hypothetical protein [Actinomycetospora endophytica]
MTAFADIVVATSTAHPGRLGGLVPSGPDALYLLVFNDPARPVTGYGTGWSLIAWTGNDRCWSTGLLAHGADARTPEADAQAVAQRVLAEHGIRVRCWRSGATTSMPMFRAQAG